MKKAKKKLKNHLIPTTKIRALRNLSTIAKFISLPSLRVSKIALLFKKLPKSLISLMNMLPKLQQVCYNHS